MGYGIIPDMKDESIVCQKSCAHGDCRANRDDFILHGDCVICGKPLNAGEHFYYHDTERLGKYAKAHAICVIEQVEQAEKHK